MVDQVEQLATSDRNATKYKSERMSELVGRIAQYQGQIVSICGYISKDQRWQVVPLQNRVTHISNTRPAVVTFEELIFHPSVTFSGRNPHTTLSTPDRIFPGDAVDLSETDLSPAALNEHNVWEISSSCRIRGAPVINAKTASGPPSPITTISSKVHVSMANRDDIVEFEDIYFNSPSADNAVYISACKHVVFRRCRFRAQSDGVYFAGCYGSADKTATVTATFERCLFANCKSSGMFVPGTVAVNLLDCTFDTCHSGVTVLGGGHLLAQFCGFQRCTYGAHCTNKNSFLELKSCTFINNKTGVCNGYQGKCVLKHCNIGIAHGGECQCGVEVSGPQRTVTVIDDCVVAQCKIGVSLQFGKVDFVMNNSEVSGSTDSVGVHVRYDTVGNIDFMDCQISSFDIWSSVRCLVTVNEIAVPPKPLYLIKEKAKYVLKGMSVFQLRRIKKARVDDVICWGCRIVEPEGAKFKICGRCQCVCYCSKACQVNDWEFHSKSCRQA